MTTEASADATLTTDAKLKEIIAEQEEIFVRRQPTPSAWPSRPSSTSPAASPPAGRSPRRSRSGSAAAAARRSGTSTATSTSTCTAATAPPWPAMPTRRSRRPSPTRPATAPTSPSPPRTPSRWRHELARRFGLPSWRFANSGTEATMDAVHLMRSITGRDLIIKIEGCYHGHHDSVQVSVAPEQEVRGPAGQAQQRPLVLRHPEGHHRPDADRHVQRPRQRGPPAGRAPGPDRGHDPRAGHDERRDHQARARLPREPQGTSCTNTAPCSPSTR